MATTATAQRQSLSRHGIGASEIAAITGLHPYASPWDVWLRKTGQAPDVEETEPMEWGIRLEPAIRQKYVDHTRSCVAVPLSSMFHAEHQWARATPDGIVVGEVDAKHGQYMLAPDKEKWRHLLQCKNVGTWAARDWEAGPPVYVQLQEMWEMHVTGLTRADVAVLIGGNEFRVYTVHRDDKTITDLVTIAEDFWRKCESRTPPKIDDSEACQKHFEKRLKREAIELVADEETEVLFAEWMTLKSRQKADDKREKTIRNLVREQMADAGATIIKSQLGDAKLTIPADPTSKSVVNWKHVAELLGSTKCTPAEFAELVAGATATLTPEPTAPVLYAPRNWSKES